MSKLVETFTALAATFDDLHTRWYVFGAQAAIFHGIARATADIDVTVDIGDHSMLTVSSTLVAHGFTPRFDDPEFIERSRVLPVTHSTGIPVDVVIAGPGLEDLFFERAVRRTVGRVAVPVASAEDVIVMKILAGRPKDLEDIRGIIAAKRGLDVNVVRETLGLLEAALDQSDLLPVFEQAWQKRR